MNAQIPPDDAERVERTMTSVADRIDAAWLKALSRVARSRRLSPPAFRHRLVEASRAANKRIVLPEGAEPRTVAAAAIVAARGIARCVLLGKPTRSARWRASRASPCRRPRAHRPGGRRAPLCGPLVERRKGKGMTPEQAAVSCDGSWWAR